MFYASFLYTQYTTLFYCGVPSAFFEAKWVLLTEMSEKHYPMNTKLPLMTLHLEK
jgi:hypothetical protein